MVFLIASSGLVLANNGWYSTLQGASSDVDQTIPPDGVTLQWSATDSKWHFSYANVPSGGTTGYILTKNSNSNYDYSWQPAGTASNITGLITAGTNITLSGNGTSGTPYVINSSGGSSNWSQSGSNIYPTTATNVGIGTTNPGSTLDITGTVRATTFIGNGAQLTSLPNVASSTTGQAAYFDVSSAHVTGTNNMIISGTNTYFNQGNVGIGTAVPISNLEINNQNWTSGTGTGLTLTGATTNNSNYPTVLFKGGTLATTYPMLGLSNGGYSFQMVGGYGGGVTTNIIMNVDSSAGFSLVDNSKNLLNVLPLGNVGIGSTSPGQALDVQGTVRATTIIAGTGGITLGGVNNTSWPAGSGTVTSSGSPVSGNIAQFSSATNITPATYSQIVGLFSGCSGTQYLGYDGNCHTASGSSQWTGTNPIYFNGNVGIGSTNPGQTLDVSGTVRATQFIGSGANLTNLPDVVSGTVGQGAYYAASTNQVSGTNNMIISGTNTYFNQGNVGIGSTIPDAPLNINLGVTTVSNAVNVYGNYGSGGFIDYNIQNTNSAGQSGFNATADNGTLTTNFAYFGINNSAFNTVAAYNIGGAGDIEVLGLDNDMYVGNGTAGKNVFISTGGTAASNIRATFDGNGNIGIGTVTATSRLHIHGTGTTTAQSFDVADSSGNDHFTILDIGNVGIGSINPGTQLDVQGTVRVTATGTLGLTTTGNVGIGSLSPGQILDIQGSLRVMGGGTVSIGTTLANNALSIMGNVSIGTATAAVNGFTVYQPSGNGNVSIGTSAAATAMLSVGTSQQFKVTNAGAVTAVGLAAGGAVSGVTTLGASGLATFSGNGNFITNSGTNPTITGTNTTASDGMTITGSGATSGFLKLQSTSGVGATDMIQFLTGNNGALKPITILSNTGVSNVGIGSVNPGATLDVNGTVSGNLFRLNGNCKTSTGDVCMVNGQIGICTAGTFPSCTTCTPC